MEKKDSIIDYYIEQVAQNTGNLIYIKDLNGNYIFFNKTAEDFFGKKSSEVIGKSDEFILSLADAETFTSEDKKIIESGTTISREGKITTVSGNVGIFLITKGPVFDEDSKVAGMYGLLHNITDRKEIENEIRTILRTTIDAFYIVDKNGNFLDVNDAYSKMTGYSREEILKMGIKDVEALESEEMIKERIKKISEAGYDRFETKHKCKDGSVVNLDASVTLLKDGSGKMFCFMRDITERKKFEAENAETLRRTIELNRFMTEREIKMAELKVEIIKLKEQLNKCETK